MLIPIFFAALGLFCAALVIVQESLQESLDVRTFRVAFISFLMFAGVGFCLWGLIDIVAYFTVK